MKDGINQQSAFYSMSEEKVFEKMQTNLAGLTRHEASERLENYGKNNLKKKEKIIYFNEIY